MPVFLFWNWLMSRRTQALRHADEALLTQKHRLLDISDAKAREAQEAIEHTRMLAFQRGMMTREH